MDQLYQLDLEDLEVRLIHQFLLIQQDLVDLLFLFRLEHQQDPLVLLDRPALALLEILFRRWDLVLL